MLPSLSPFSTLSTCPQTLVLAPLKLRSLRVRHQGCERRKAASCPDLPAVSVLGFCRERAINHISPVYIIICNCFLNHSGPTACFSSRLLVLQGEEMRRRLGVPRNLLGFPKAARLSQNPAAPIGVLLNSQGIAGLDAVTEQQQMVAEVLRDSDEKGPNCSVSSKGNSLHLSLPKAGFCFFQKRGDNPKSL